MLSFPQVIGGEFVRNSSDSSCFSGPRIAGVLVAFGACVAIGVGVFTWASRVEEKKVETIKEVAFWPTAPVDTAGWSYEVSVPPSPCCAALLLETCGRRVRGRWLISHPFLPSHCVAVRHGGGP